MHRKFPKSHDPPIRTWRTRMKGGRMGVKVSCWRIQRWDKETKTRYPYPIFKAEVNCRTSTRPDAEWVPKITWHLAELETLFHILRQDAIPFGRKLLAGEIEE